jgi:hypothetical protein
MKIIIPRFWDAKHLWNQQRVRNPFPVTHPTSEVFFDFVTLKHLWFSCHESSTCPDPKYPCRNSPCLPKNITLAFFKTKHQPGWIAVQLPEENLNRAASKFGTLAMVHHYVPFPKWGMLGSPPCWRPVWWFSPVDNKSLSQLYCWYLHFHSKIRGRNPGRNRNKPHIGAVFSSRPLVVAKIGSSPHPRRSKCTKE